MKPIYDKTRNFKVKKKFTILPKRLNSDEIAFLGYYMTIEQKAYPHQNLPPTISVPDKPFWIEVHSQLIPDNGVVSEETVIRFEFEEYIRKILN